MRIMRANVGVKWGATAWAIRVATALVARWPGRSHIAPAFVRSSGRGGDLENDRTTTTDAAFTRVGEWKGNGRTVRGPGESDPAGPAPAP
jgi:hypothetical protein